MEVIFIHGANSTATSWNWVGSHVRPNKMLSWEMDVEPEINLKRMELYLPDRCIVVGHSMGGLYAWHLAERNPDKVVHGVSLGTPFGGSIQASFWRLFNIHAPWLGMLSRMEPWTMKTRLIGLDTPWTNIITNRGFDLFGIGANDGVVTVDSQRDLYSNANEITLDYGHNEVLQSPELVGIIQDLVSRYSSYL